MRINLPTILVAAVLISMIAAAVIFTFKNRGKGTCSGDCSACQYKSGEDCRKKLKD